jgi:DNA-binding response OmpR family regulator
MKLSLSEVFSTLARAGGAPRVLCADDDPNVLELCAVALVKAGFAPDRATNGREVLEKIQDNKYAAILLDLAMPSVHGATVLSLLQREHPELLRRVIVVTGMADAVVDGLRVPVAAVLRKPVSVDALVSKVNEVTARREKRRGSAEDTTVRI